MDILLADTPDNIKRRRAMLLGLQSLFDSEQSLTALCIWERDYADSSSAFIGVHTYAKSICEHFGKNDKRRELHAALLDALFQSEDKLPPDPSAAMRQVPPQALLSKLFQSVSAEQAMQAHARMPVPNQAVLAPAPATAKLVAVPAVNTTLCLLLSNLRSALAELDPAASGNFAIAMQRAIPALRLPGDTSVALQRCLHQPDEPAFAAAISVKQASGVVNLLYVWMAENLGPEQADKLLARLIAQVEHDPLAKGFGVRQLL